MSEVERRGIDCDIAFHGAPTLLGVKCANLISVARNESVIAEYLCEFMEKMSAEGFCARQLCKCRERTLVYIYNVKMLDAWLKMPQVNMLLEEYGYTSDMATEEMLDMLLNNYQEAIAIILFAIGFATLIFQRNLIRKIIGLNIMDTGLFLFLTSLGYVEGRKAPIIVDGVTDASQYVNPIPAGLVLTGIVVSVSVTAVMLSLSIRLYKKYHTLDMDEVYRLIQKEKEDRI